MTFDVLGTMLYTAFKTGIIVSIVLVGIGVIGRSLPFVGSLFSKMRRFTGWQGFIGSVITLTAVVFAFNLAGMV